MSQEATPAVTAPKPSGLDAAPQGLLQQMEELMETLTANLSQLDAELRTSAERLAADPAAPFS